MLRGKGFLRNIFANGVQNSDRMKLHLLLHLLRLINRWISLNRNMA